MSQATKRKRKSRWAKKERKGNLKARWVKTKRWRALKARSKLERASEATSERWRALKVRWARRQRMKR